MGTKFKKVRTVAVYVGLSVVVHLLVLISLGRFGNYSFAAPVNPLQAVMVDLAKQTDSAPAADPQDTVAEDAAEDGDTSPNEAVNTPPAVQEKALTEPKSVEPAAFSKEKTDSTTKPSEPPPPKKAAASQRVVSASEVPPPLRTASEFISSKSEKLSYLISLLGVPVGSVDLEAKNEKGEVRITLRTKSYGPLASIYPVDDIMETRHLGGNFIITKIRQHEGSFTSDIGFTIFLRDKRVFWVDRIRQRQSNETIPNSDVLDTLSSFYYLRNRPLQIGNTEILHIYDGDIYAPVPVEVLRREEIRLRNLKTVDSLVLRHVKQEGGIFRRTGDMTIWLTNDENKVPVKVETSTPFGTATVELVSSESQPFDKPGTKISPR